MDDPLHFDEAEAGAAAKTNAGGTPTPWAPGASASAPPTPPNASASSELKIPPPPSDIAVRTMESDIASLGLTGGNRVQSRSMALEMPQAKSARHEPSSTARFLKLFLIGAGVLVVIVLVLYFVFSTFFVTKPLPTQTTPTSQLPVPVNNTAAQSTTTASSPAQTGTAPVASAPVAVPPFTHQSFLQTPASQTLTLTLGQQAQSAAQLQTYAQQLAQVLATANPKASSLEIDVQSPQNTALSFGQFMYAINAPLIDQNFLAQNFNPDFTIFVYKDQNGFWPSYILQLNADKNWLFVTPQVAQMENSQSLEVIFPSNPGTRSADGFQSDTIGGQAVRVLSYSNPNAQFVYGWLRNYLIISTSRNAFQATLNQL